jgi:hypothetical protein
MQSAERALIASHLKPLATFAQIKRRQKFGADGIDRTGAGGDAACVETEVPCKLKRPHAP